jgi:hypothetical protein
MTDLQDSLHLILLQGRRRAVFLGALNGKEQLPPFPAQTHRCLLPDNQCYPKATESCRVELPSSAKTAREKKVRLSMQTATCLLPFTTVYGQSQLQLEQTEVQGLFFSAACVSW